MVSLRHSLDTFAHGLAIRNADSAILGQNDGGPELAFLLGKVLVGFLEFLFDDAVVVSLYDESSKSLTHEQQTDLILLTIARVDWREQLQANMHSTLRQCR